MKFWRFIVTFWVFLLLLFTPATYGYAQTPVVRAVLFFAPTCNFCHKVIDEILPPLADQYREKLDVVGIDITQPKGQELYQAALAHYQVTDDRVGVPTLIIGDTVLVGAQEIPDQLPGIIEKGIQAGGIDWPAIPGLAEVLASQPQNPTSQPVAAPQVESSQPLFIQKFMQDPLANTIAVVVLLLMLGSMIGVGYIFVAGSESKALRWPHWAIPVIAVAGLGVALYLSYIELFGAKAICGPVGNCNSVQESSYAYLFGILPVGVMGAAGYIAIIAAWLAQQYGTDTWKKNSALALWGMAWFGILFSVYLTFLEPFVIGATCAWCISSALLMTFMLWASTQPAMDAMRVGEDDEDADIEADSQEFSI